MEYLETYNVNSLVISEISSYAKIGSKIYNYRKYNIYNYRKKQL